MGGLKPKSDCTPTRVEPDRYSCHVSLPKFSRVFLRRRRSFASVPERSANFVEGPSWYHLDPSIGDRITG